MLMDSSLFLTFPFKLIYLVTLILTTISFRSGTGSSPNKNKLKWRLPLLVKVESLDRMFEQINNSNHSNYRGRCRNCGSDVEVEITKIGGGYGLLGGVLFEADQHNFLILCADCYEKSGRQIHDPLYLTSPEI